MFKSNLIEEMTICDFRASGLLWLINTTLHVFGVALVVDTKTQRLFPARVKFRGFDEATNEAGYVNVSQYLKDNADKLMIEVRQ